MLLVWVMVRTPAPLAVAKETSVIRFQHGLLAPAAVLLVVCHRPLVIVSGVGILGGLSR